ncbi:1-deoxy-11-beta-hydroxypentalenate dehydrogenase [Alphaproteobacteria bacterium SO-S41]|nr:1-deoxy-11-beta-hydroxypentalenate dehydrogenase [Alphaproteobacteria bacterium SO-S41]
MKDFRNKVAVITGGASGIGLAVARALGREGAKLVIADIEQGALDKAVPALIVEGFEAEGVRTDVSDRNAIIALADRTWQRFGGCNVVFHNAGVAVFGPVQTMTDKDWKWSIDVNLWGPVHGTEVFLPRMLKDGQDGHMIFTASFAGIVPNRSLGPYNVTKAAVVALAESLHKDLRSTPLGASVLCPMRVTTAIDNSARNRPESLGGATAAQPYADAESGSLQGRTLSVEPVADLVLDAIRENRLYIHTHKEAKAFFDGRAAKISAAFDNAL